MAITHFSEIKDQNLKPFKFDKPAFLQDNLSKVVRFAP